MTLTTAFFAYVKGEKSQAELDGYRRAVSRIDELEAGLENETRGRAPWDLPEHLEQALVFSWIARGLATIANTLLESDELEDPLTAGYLPVVTFDQAKALYQQVPPVLEKAWEALANPRFKTDRPLPQFLGPRIEAEGTCPLVHLKGIQAAARALDLKVERRLASSVAHLRLLGATPPSEVHAVMDDVDQLRARARTKLAFSNDQLAALEARRPIPPETHEEAETRLWEALGDHFLLGQLLARPALVKSSTIAGHTAQGRPVKPDDRWRLSEATAVRDLGGTKFGEQEILEFWQRKGWRTTAVEERYLAQTAALLAEGAISVVSRWSTCPFAPVFQTLRPIHVLDRPITRCTEFYLDMNEDVDELKVGRHRFHRTSGYEEEHDEGHVRDPGRH